MIKKSMPNMAIIKELKSIDDIMLSRRSGYMKKFAKKLKSNAYKHNDVLDVREYEINGNKVLVCFQKLVFTDKLSDLGVSTMVITEDNGAFIPSTDELGNFTFCHITNHAIRRMWRRMRMTINDFFVNEYVINADTALHPIKYEEYGYDDSTYIVSIGRCFFIVCESGNNIVVKTVIDWDNLHSNQMRLYIDSKRGADKYAYKMYEMAADSLKRTGFKKTSDFIKMCA